MYKQIQLLTILLFLQTFLFGQEGSVFIKNFNQKEYQGALQNWTVVQDHRGMIYVGNNGAILEFDGSKWNYIPVLGGGNVRSLAITKKGVLYIAADDKIGYLQPDIEGDLQFISLKELLPNEAEGPFWKVICQDNHTYFYCSEAIYKWNGKDFTKINISKGTLVNNDASHIYSSSRENGLSILKDNTFIALPEGSKLRNKNIFSTISLNRLETIIATEKSGIFIFNKKYNSIIPVKGSAHNLLTSSEVYCGIRLNKKMLAFGTLNQGIIFTDLKGNLIRKISLENGLSGNTIYDLKVDDQGGLWVAMSKGISRVEINSHISKFDKSSGINSVVKNSCNHNGVTYVGTFDGLLKMNQKGELTKVPEVKKIVWDMLEVSNHVLIASTDGIFLINPNQTIEKISKLSAYSFYRKNNIVWTGLQTGLTALQVFDDEFIVHNNVVELGANVLNIATTDNNNIYIGTRKQGIWHLDISENLISKLGPLEGIQSGQGNKVFTLQDKIHAATKEGLLQLEDGGKFVPAPLFSHLPSLSKSYISQISVINDNYLILSKLDKQKQRLYKVYNDQGKYAIDSISLARIPSMVVFGIDAQVSKLWISGSEGLFTFNYNLDFKKLSKFSTHIRSVTIGKDSTLFYGANISDNDSFTYTGLKQHPEINPKISSQLSNIKFQFSCSSYDNFEENQYRYRLDGLESKWSKWSSLSHKEYTKLYEGKYTMMVQSRNVHNIISPVATYSFRILPPWYRTIWAFLGYSLALISSIYCLLRINSARLEREKKQLEKIVKERTTEIRNKKDEIESKNVQLESQKEEILAQQEKLQVALDNLEELNKDLSAKNKHINDSIEYAKSIQEAILPGMNTVKGFFSDSLIYFKPKSKVSGDFYFYHQPNDKEAIWASADCTGHGVPGSLMTMICHSALEKEVLSENTEILGNTLDNIRKSIVQTLNKKGTVERKDGMDIALLRLDIEKLELQYSGAYNSLYILRDQNIIEITADRQPIGVYMGPQKPFSSHTLKVLKGDRIIIFSDGYMDQIGGKYGKRFGKYRFQRIIKEHSNTPLSEMEKNLDRALIKWKDQRNQTDDITIFIVEI